MLCLFVYKLHAISDTLFCMISCGWNTEGDLGSEEADYIEPPRGEVEIYMREITITSGQKESSRVSV